MEYDENHQAFAYPNIEGTVLNDQLKPGSYIINPIDFSFPFYGQFFDTIIVHTNGILLFDTSRLPIPYQVNDVIAYKLIKMIAPFQAQDLRLKQSLGNEIIYEGNEEYAAFRWKESYKIESDYFPVDFTCILNKDGRIEYYYNPIELPDRANWLTGISNGDNINFSLSDYSKITNSKDGYLINYIPQNFISEMNINNEGLLSVGTEDFHKIYNLTIKVTDDRWISSEKSLQLSSSINYDYSIHSGSDSQIDYGETAYINISIKNIGDIPLNNVLFSVQNSEQMITLLETSEFIGNLNPGETSIIYDAFSFEVSEQIPNEYFFIFQTTITSATNFWEGQMNFEAYAPELNLMAPIVLEGQNGRPDPGDTVNIVFPVSNYNGSLVENVSGEVVTSDPYISFIGSNSLYYGSLDKNSIKNDTVTIVINENTPDSHYADFEISVFNPELFLINEPCQMLIGKYPLLLINVEPSPISADTVAFYFDRLNIPFHSLNHLGSDLSAYQAIFICLGKFSSYTLSDYDAERLAGYLNSGGRLYMEGAVTWYDDLQTIVHPMFNFEIDPFDWNLIDTIVGATGTFADSCFFNYYGNMPYYNYSLGPIEPAFPLLKSYSKNHIFSVAYQNNIYKTIGSNINFGRLRNEPGDSSKINLMKNMLVFFEVIDTTSTFIPEHSGYLTTSLNCFPNPANNQLTISFQLPDKEICTNTSFDKLQFPTSGNTHLSPTARSPFKK